MVNKFYILLFILLPVEILAIQKPSLIFYVGSTMSRAMSDIAKIIEVRNNCNIKIVQGASKSLYDLIKTSKQGDLFLPGSKSFITNNLKDGFFLDSKFIGYNQAVICVKESNPKNIRSLDDFLDENIATMLCDPIKGSIGRATKKLLKSYKGEDFLDRVYDNSVRIAIDSKDLYQVFNQGKIDAVINWKAVVMWSKNRNIDIIEIDERFAPKSELHINLLKFSKYPKIVKDLMQFASSKDGQDIMRRYGF